ncbi:MAG: class I SAM-dependent rRNA methyltransferase [Clostridia bacterium]|nr:class I SAM-dependent rRNA methyltransferase [Clostridia bacterium]
MPYTLYLKKNEEKRILAGHPWVYANEVSKIEGKDKNGTLATVRDFNGRFIGRGFINHLSKIIVRIISRNEEEVIDQDFFEARIRKAVALRQKLGYDNCYRAVFAEADNLPGLIVDKYDDVLSIQILSLGMEVNRDKILNALIKIFNPKGIYERSDVSVRKKEGLEETKGAIYGDFDTKVVITENGVKMLVDVENGQKTGYFLDQKHNRYALRKYCKDATVLDCFCNSGGFSLNACMGGAKSVIACDISKQALDTVEENARLNGFTTITTLLGDVFEVLRNYKKDGKKFDVVVLDPPAFCKTAADVKNAYKGYKDINILGLKLVNEGGFLITSSCSHYMTLNLFEKMLNESAKESGRRVKILEMKIQSSDHPSLIGEDESMYLKYFVLHVE